MKEQFPTRYIEDLNVIVSDSTSGATLGVVIVDTVNDQSLGFMDKKSIYVSISLANKGIYVIGNSKRIKNTVAEGTRKPYDTAFGGFHQYGCVSQVYPVCTILSP